MVKSKPKYSSKKFLRLWYALNAAERRLRDAAKAYDEARRALDQYKPPKPK